MNYIRHLTGFFEKIIEDNTLNPTHISLYLSLFQFWNVNRFQNPISITRNEIMKISKICSKATYHKCMKELHNNGYLRYMPSFNPFKGSLVHLFIFDPDYNPVQNTNQNQIKNQTGNGTTACIGSEQVLVPSINYINNTKHLIHENNSNENSGTQNTKNQNSGNSEKQHQKTNNNQPANTETNNNYYSNQSITEKTKSIPPSLSQVIQFFENEKHSIIEAHRFFNHFESNGWKVGGKTPMKNWHAAARNWMLNTNKFLTPSKPHITNLNRSKNYGEPL